MTSGCEGNKIGLLIPCTSKNRNTWNKMEDTYLMTHSIETFLKTYSEEHEYIFYIGYDTDDRIYANIFKQLKLIQKDGTEYTGKIEKKSIKLADGTLSYVRVTADNRWFDRTGMPIDKPTNLVTHK